jgi:DNA-binding transcriptional LysR family regulator
MREISLDRLRTLVAITDRGSFADAARALHLAPPTVSLHIAELEDRIGAPLLSRKRGHVRPSAIGEVLVERERRLLAVFTLDLRATTDAPDLVERIERAARAARLFGALMMVHGIHRIEQRDPQFLRVLVDASSRRLGLRR